MSYYHFHTQETLVTENSETSTKSSARTEQTALVVDAAGQGDYATITEAIRAAEPGARIVVRPGLYEEGLVIDKPLEIVGEGEADGVVVQTAGRDVVLFNAETGRLANLTLRQMGGGEWYGVDIERGRLELEECDLSSESLACVAIHEGADPQLRRNLISGSKQGGVSIYENGLGTLEENKISGNGYFGVEICEGSNPVLRRNRIFNNKQSGVFIYDNAKGALEDNDIFGNSLSGVEIKADSSPVLRRNRISANRQNGILVRDDGQGILEENEIFDNEYAGVEIRDGATPTLLRNRISGNGYPAVWVHDGGGGIVEDNDLRGNPRGAWDIEPSCRANVKRARNLE